MTLEIFGFGKMTGTEILVYQINVNTRTTILYKGIPVTCSFAKRRLCKELFLMNKKDS